MQTNAKVVVVGAGIIGMATTLRLLLDGMDVTLVDPGAPGSGASYGNAGTIADYAVTPVGSPGVLQNLPSLLFNRDSPLALQRRELLAIAPWLLRFLNECRHSRFHSNIRAIHSLVHDAGDRWQTLAAEIRAEDLLKSNGCFYLYRTPAARDKGQADIKMRRELGVQCEMLDSDQLRQLEPNLSGLEGGAAFFPETRYLSDPGAMNQALFAAISTAGGHFLQAGVKRLLPARHKMVLELDNSQTLEAEHVVIAAGAYSRPFAAQIGDRIPLLTERGYHLEYEMDVPMLQRPAGWGAGGFYLSPMNNRLRVAGTVELGRNNPAVSAHRLAVMERGARSFFPDLPKADKQWLGFRPSLPDSRPVISRSSRHKQVIYAFGHGHIGMTLAPITAELVRSLVINETPAVSLAPFSAQRF